jgi:uncharacterized membrane protein
MADVQQAPTATLAVWRFGAPGLAEEMLPALERVMHSDELDVDAAALVSWPPSHRKPSVRDLGGVIHPGALWGGFWGVVLALIFLTPLAGPTFGAAAGAIAGSLTDFGVEDDFVKRVRDAVTPGTSAVFIIGSSRAIEPIAEAFGGGDVAMLGYTLSHEQAQNLREALGEENVAG